MALDSGGWLECVLWDLSGVITLGEEIVDSHCVLLWYNTLILNQLMVLG